MAEARSHLRLSGCMFCTDAGMDFDWCRVCGRGLPVEEARTTESPRPLFDGRGCGHPHDPIAERHGGLWACHCGRILDPQDGIEIPEAPGPVVQCDGCGCHVAVPNA